MALRAVFAVFPKNESPEEGVLFLAIVSESASRTGDTRYRLFGLQVGYFITQSS
jgi:hypothetical protein